MKATNIATDQWDKLMGVNTLLEYALSSSKRRKIALMLREKRHQVSFLLKGANSSLLAQDVPDESIKTDHWHYRSAVALPAEVFHTTSNDYAQDQLVKNEELLTEFHYRICSVPNASIMTNESTHRSVYDTNGTLLPELSYQLQGYAPNNKRSVDVTKHVEGTVASLYGNIAMASGNYGHWMIDGLSRLFLIKRFYDINEIDYFLVPPLLHDFHKESLLSLGIPESKILTLEALECLQCSKLICTTPPRGTSSSATPGWIIDGFRETGIHNAEPATPPMKKIYISRRDAGSRKFVNEDDIIAMLEKEGFQAIELSQYGFIEKISLFSNADYIIGLTGAGLTNFLFCKPNTTCLELFPSSYVMYLYSSIAGYLKLNYHHLIFDNQSVLSSVNKYYGNLHLDIDKLQEKMASIRS